MLKTITCLLCLLTAPYFISAQDVWNKKMPFSGLSANFVRLASDDNHYFLQTDRDFFQVDGTGTVTGHIRQETITPFWTYVRKKNSATTGHPYFLIARRMPSSLQGYTFAEYVPGIGFVNESTFADSLGGVTWLRPQVVELNDSAMVVFGRKFVRKIKHSEGAGFVEEWVKPLNIAVTTAVFENNRYMLGDDAGAVTVLDENGNFIGSQNHGIAFRILKKVSGGFIGCGRTTDGKAAFIKIDSDGVEIWKKITTDKEYRDVVPTLSGGYALAGESDSSKIMLALTDADGLQLWKKEYEPGAGAGLLQDPDGGFVIAARTTVVTSLRLFKTDANGTTTPVEDALTIMRRIRTGSIQATLFPTPSLFYDGSDATFISTTDSAAAIFAFSPWIGGKDDNDSLHLAANDYYGNPSFPSDYRPGLAQSSARDFNRIWAVDRESIAALRQDFGVDQTLDMPVPPDLLSWPGKGNPYLRQNLDFTPFTTDPALFPAPFVDANGDGNYNVYDGDYPRIKGDQMLWWALTDSTEHGRTNAPVLGIDLYVTVYAYNCPQAGSVDKSLFADFEVINRSATTYHDVYAGFFTDYDLGCYEDDYIGTVPDANTFYAYNQDNFDGNCTAGIPGFNEDIPVQTTTFLNRSLDHSMYFNNPGVSNPPAGISDPELAGEFYNFLQGKWRDGTPLTTGGIGYNPASTNYADYVFPGNPADPQGWTMCSENLSFADRRMVGSHGPFGFAAGDTFHFQVAFTLHADIPHPCPDVFGLVKPAVEQISQWKNNGALDVSVDLGQVVHLPPGQSVALDPGTVPGATYLWSTGASTPAITVSQPGEYSVTVTPATGCQIVENVLVQLGSSADQPLNVPVWKVRPNPAGDFVIVECVDCADGEIQAVLSNAQGSALLSMKRQNRQFRIDTNNFPPGLYWLELRQHGQFMGSRKLVVTGK